MISRKGKLTDGAKQRYLDGNATRCPYCDAEDIIGGDASWDYLIASRETNCLRCGESWVEVFQMTTIEAAG